MSKRSRTFYNTENQCEINYQTSNIQKKTKATLTDSISKLKHQQKNVYIKQKNPHYKKRKLKEKSK